MAGDSNKSFWPNKSALVISDESNLYLVMRELVKADGWRIDIPPCSAKIGTEYIHNGNVSAVIVIDSPSSPASENLRVLFRDHRARLTPTMVLIPESFRNDAPLYEKIFKVNVATKPLTPNNFIPSFKRMIKTWEAPIMVTLRRVSYLNGHEHDKTRQSILEKLIPDAFALPYALPALLELMLQLNQFKEAEKILVDTFKTNPRNANLLAICGWFYITAKMPQQALRFISKLKTMAPQSTIFNLDMITTNLACGNLGDAIGLMKEWHEHHPGNEFMENYMARVLIADGKQDSGEAAGISKAVMRKISDYWDFIENPEGHAKPASSQGLKVS